MTPAPTAGTRGRRPAVQRLLAATTSLTGWRRRLVALVTGAVSAAAMPPFGVAWILFLTLPILVLLLDGVARASARRRRVVGALSIGWWFGFGYFLAGLWWIGSAFLVEAEAFAWMIPFAVAGLPAGLALFYGAGAGFAMTLWQPGPGRIVALAVGLSGAEWLRGHVLTGFPWNGLGYALAADDALMQAASLVGVYGLALLSVLFFASSAAVVRDGALVRGREVLGPAAALLLLLGMAIWGSARLGDPPASDTTSVPIRIVQPSIDQADKWKPELATTVFETYLSLTEEPASDGGARPDGLVVIWPETAVPFLLSEAPVAVEAIADSLPPGGRLLTGAVRVERNPEAVNGADYFNSILQVAPDGHLSTLYDKVHLVPFGEFLPFQDLVERIGLEQLTQLPGGFSAGVERTSLQVEGLPPFSPLICYEIVFPGAALNDADRPAWILNVTNDAWFGLTPGPYQHLLQARVRAVEEGVPVIRAANTGVSAVIDANGRVVSRLGLGESGIIDAALPAVAPPTLYARAGDGPFWAAVVLAFILLVLSRQRISRRRKD